MVNRPGITFTNHGGSSCCNIKNKTSKFSSSPTPKLAATPFFLRTRATAAIIGLSLVATRNTLLQVVLGSSSNNNSSTPSWLEQQQQQQRASTTSSTSRKSSFYERHEQTPPQREHTKPTTSITTLLLVQLLPLIPSIKPNIGLSSSFISSQQFARRSRTNLIFGIPTCKNGQTNSIVDRKRASIVLLRQHSEKQSNAEEEALSRFFSTQEKADKTKNYLPFHASWKRGSNNNSQQRYRFFSTMSSSTATITLDVLQRKDASTTNAILDYFHSNELFDKWADYQSKLILTRDMEDGEKLQKGIDIAVDRGTLNKLTTIEPYLDVDVVGKTPHEVATFIWNQVLEQKKALGEETNNEEEGELIVLCGLSGTGKGTTFATLGNKLRIEKKDPSKVVNWSNGNVFRSVTLLCVLWCENQGPDVHVPSALTKENISNFMKMLTFGKYDEKFDIRIQGMGLDTTVSQIENTLLKQTRVAKNIPTVAEQIQGEVVKFANDAMVLLKQAGMTILLEGREQTLNYMTTPYKFRLILSDESLIGKRRAAQRLMAQTLERIQNHDDSDTILDIHDILDNELQSLAKEDLGDGAK